MEKFENILRLKNSKEWIEFDRYCNTGFLEQIDFFRYEDMHTNFLASLLKENNVFGLGTKPLKLFIELLKVKDKNHLENKLQQDLLSNYSVSNVHVIPQFYIKDVGRIDLLIKFNIGNNNYNIILENKLFSGESSKDQTKRYKEYLDKVDIDINNDDNKNATKIYVFLSLDNNPKTNPISAEDEYKDEYIRIDYQELISYVLEPCSYLEVNSLASISVEEYLKGFTYLCEFGYMPITSTLRKLSVAIYNNYSEELINILNGKQGEYNEFYSNNIKQFKILFTVLEKEVTTKKNLKDKINRIVLGKVGKFRKKDNDEYTDYGCREQTKMVRDILKDLIDNGYLKTIKGLEELKFSDNSSWKPTITEEQYKAVGNRQSNYSKDNDLIVESKTLYYSYPVSNEELKGFVECVIKKYPNYKKLIEVC